MALGPPSRTDPTRDAEPEPEPEPEPDDADAARRSAAHGHRAWLDPPPPAFLAATVRPTHHSRLLATAALLLVPVLVAFTGGAAGAAVPPTDAPPGTWRGQVEAWVGTQAYPALLGRPAPSGDRRYHAHQAVLTSPGHVARALAGSPEARRLQAGWAYEQGLARPSSDADRRWWATRLASGWTHDRMVAHLLGSPEASARRPADPAWVAWAYQQALGRGVDAPGSAFWVARLGSGTPRWVLARQVLATPEARRRTVTAIYLAVLGRAPGATERDRGVATLAAAGGNPQRLRAEVVAALAPGGLRVAVAGDSVAFSLTEKAVGQALPAVVTGAGQRPRLGGRLACGVISARAGYDLPPGATYFPDHTGWGLPGDGLCPQEVSRIERAMLDWGAQVVIWPIGAWEGTAVRRPDGTVLPARSPALRSELAAEMVRRIDIWTARTVRKVVLPEWACVGRQTPADLRSTTHVRWVRSILDEVVARRPAVAVIAATPPELCVGGDPEGLPTPAGSAAREGAFHWAEGPRGAAWGWRTWFAPAVADLPSGP
ncbi:MAG TPA: DUF4214 domain-containing protein [Acidimicrobiales bacterium]|nr:DUF4214 domain-containing protein [Acidimicrobiales bacterium]